LKAFNLSERVAMKLEADAFNLFNHPSFDAPNGNFALNGCFNPYPCFPSDMTQILAPGSPNSANYGVIRQTVGSNRFLQLSMHLTF
jgi:UDP-N-acetylglucosamine enolpyruvyl transferase